MKFAKFISEDCAAGAPDTKDGKPYTEEMARADGFLPLVVEEADKSIKRRKSKYRLENDTVVEYYVEDDRPEEKSDMEIFNENIPSDEELQNMSKEQLQHLGITLH